MRWWWLAGPKHWQRQRVDRFWVIRIIWFNYVRIVRVACLRVACVRVFWVDALWRHGLRIGLDRVGSVRIHCVGKP